VAQRQDGRERQHDAAAPTRRASGRSATTNAAPSKDAPQDLGNEKVKVGAGEFDCKHWKMSSDAGGLKTTTDSWTYKSLLVKMVSTNDNMTTTMELTKLDKK